MRPSRLPKIYSESYINLAYHLNIRNCFLPFVQQWTPTEHPHWKTRNLRNMIYKFYIVWGQTDCAHELFRSHKNRGKPNIKCNHHHQKNNTTQKNNLLLPSLGLEFSSSESDIPCHTLDCYWITTMCEVNWDLEASPCLQKYTGLFSSLSLMKF